MQAGDGDESVAHLAAHDGVRCIEGRADDVRCRFENTAKCGRIAFVQHALPRGGSLTDQIHVRRGMKRQQLFIGGESRLEQLRPLVQAAGFELAQERIVTVGPEGMAFAEAIAREPFTYDDGQPVSRQPGSHLLERSRTGDGARRWSLAHGG